MSSSLESQESVEDVITDTPPGQKHQNGSDSPTSTPPKRQKVKKQKRLCKETVKQDTAQVMRSYLIRCNSLTEEDLEDDLEVDADDESADESASQKEIIDKIANTLAKMGDEVEEKYKKENPQISEDLNKLITKLISQEAYDTFKNKLRDFSNIICGNDLDVDSLAFVFYLTKRFTIAAKDAGRNVEELFQFGQQYINEVYGGWIEEQGGWGQVLGEGSAV